MAGSSGGGHPTPQFFNRHQSATYGTDRFGRDFLPLFKPWATSRTPALLGGSLHDVRVAKGAWHRQAPGGVSLQAPTSPKISRNRDKMVKYSTPMVGGWHQQHLTCSPAHGHHEALRPGSTWCWKMCNRPRTRGPADKAVGTSVRLPVEGGVKQHLATLRGARLYVNILEYAMCFFASAVWHLLLAAAMICVFR